MSIALFLLLLGLGWLLVYIYQALNFCHMLYIYNLYTWPKTATPAHQECSKPIGLLLKIINGKLGLPGTQFPHHWLLSQSRPSAVFFFVPTAVE